MSVVRIGIIAAIFGVVFVIAGLVLFSIEQESYRSPLVIDPPQGAIFRGEERLGGTNNRLYYETTASVDEVVAYYNQLMAEFYQGEEFPERCRRNPAGTAFFPDYAPGNGIVPFQHRCLFQRSGIRGVERSTEVFIQPGVRNDATGMDNTGLTRIEHVQYWQP